MIERDDDGRPIHIELKGRKIYPRQVYNMAIQIVRRFEGSFAHMSVTYEPKEDSGGRYKIVTLNDWVSDIKLAAYAVLDHDEKLSSMKSNAIIPRGDA